MEIGGSTRQVSGCGQSAIYVSNGRAWVLNSELKTSAPESDVAIGGVEEAEAFVAARLEEGRAKDGSKQLELYLRGEGWMLYVKATPRSDAEVATLVWRLRRDQLASPCEIKLVANGERVELTRETKLVATATMLDYRSSLTYASLFQLASSQRVVGRLCDTEIALSDEQLAKARELAVRIREEQVLNQEPVRTADEAKVAPTEL